MATYYVQNGGDDEALGTEGAPWAHCPGMLDWSPGASGNSISAGDTVYFDSGDTWTFDAEANTGLTVTGGVTFDGATWGSGTRATFQGAYTLYRAIIHIADDDATYETVVTGFAIDGGGGSNYYNTGVSVNWPVCTQDLNGAIKRISNNVITNTGTGAVPTYDYGILVGAVGSYDTEHVEVLNNSISGTGGEGLDVYVSSEATGYINDVLVRGNEVTDTGAIGVANANCTSIIGDVRNLTIEFNYYHDVNNVGIGTSERDSDFFSDLIVRYNIIKTTGSDGIRIGNSSATGSGVFYANLIISPGVTGIVTKVGAGAADHSYRFYNNTIYNPTDHGIRIETTAQGFSVLEVKNNVIYKTGQYCLRDDDADITAHNNNIYHRPGGGNVVYSNGSSYTDLTVTNYEATAYSSDPTFKAIGSLPTGFSGTYGANMIPDTDGLSTESGNALDNGADLGGTYNGAINLTGKSGGLIRPQGSGWDIGAYEEILSGGDYQHRRMRYIV